MGRCPLGIKENYQSLLQGKWLGGGKDKRLIIYYMGINKGPNWFRTPHRQMQDKINKDTYFQQYLNLVKVF